MTKINYRYRLCQTESPMSEDEINNIASDGCRLVSFVHLTHPDVFQYAFEVEVKEERVRRDKEVIDEEEAFVEEIYKMYPTKCPKRNKPLGKCEKNRAQIRTLMKRYTKEQIRSVVEHELSEKLGKDYLKNFTTFLNQFPDPEMLDNAEQSKIDLFTQKDNGWE